ncbi:MAG: 50S ribosomal protein L11 methyltransferase [Kiloniellales bacterium]
MAEGQGPAWRVGLAVPPAALPAFEAALAELGGALAIDEPRGSARVPISVYLTEAPDRARLTALLAAAALASGLPVPEAAIERLPATDWVAESRKALPAIAIGPFYLYGAHVSAPPPAGAIPILIEAGPAFGTGRHESTRGCLLALADLAAARRVMRALDLGCGSGVLAIAIAKLWACPVLAVDSDPQALGVARDNAAANGVGGLVEARLGEGFDGAAIGPDARFDLVVANILAEPLRAMAPDLMRRLAPGGVAVLSGLLTGQDQAVLEAHAPHKLVRRIALGDWVTLVLSA